MRNSVKTYGALFALALLLTITFVIYRVGLPGPLLLDDYAWQSKFTFQTLDAETVSDLIFSGGRLHDTTRGLGRLSWALSRYIYGDTPYPLKLKNLILHLCNGLLLFWFLLLCVRAKETTDAEYADIGLPLSVTAIWLLHPLHVSTVLYAVQHIVILSTFFSLIALIAYLKGRSLAARRPYAGFLLATTSVGSTVFLGLMAKETAALVPFQILLLEITLLSRKPISQQKPLITKVLFSTIWAVPFAVAILAAPIVTPSFMEAYAVRPFTLLERVLTEFHVIAFYLKLLLVPIPGNMSLFHDSFPVTQSVDASTVLIVSVHAAIIGGAALLRRRASWLSFGVLWFYLCHTLESTIFPLELVFEHRNYLASVGVFVAAVWTVQMVFRHLQARFAKTFVLFGALTLLSANTLSRAHTWSDLKTLLAVDYQSRPTSTRVLSNLAIMKANDGRVAMANHFLTELRAADPPSAGGDVLFLLINCALPNSDAFSSAYTSALHGLRHGILDAFTANTLTRLIKAHLSERCENLDASAARTLLVAASANDRTRADLTCLVAGIHGLFDLTYNDFSSAKRQLRRGVHVCETVDMTSLRMFLAAFLGQALRQDSLQEVSAMLEDITSTETPRNISAAYPGWFHIQLQHVNE